jgi:hypothetical protein
MAKILIKKNFNVNDVSLLLKMDGSNGSTSFIDSSKNNITVTAFGNAQISTAQSKFDGSSAYFDGTGGTYIRAGNAVSFETGDFTIEAWIYPTDNTKGNSLFSIGTSNDGLLLSINGLTVNGNSYNWNNYNYISFNTWSHIALVRNSGIMKIYVNGVEKFSSYIPDQLYTNKNLYCGNGYYTLGSAQNAFQGYVDNIRIIQGKARYTSNFTPEQICQLNIKKVIEGSQVSSISGLSLWLKADAGVTIGGGNVNTWADQSSNGNNATGPATKKPTFVSNGINGKPTMSFNGTTQLFQINDSNSLDVTNCSIYIVLQRNGNGTGNEVTFMKNASDNAENAVYWQTARLNGGNSNFAVNSISYPDRNTNVYLGDGLPRIMSFSYDGSGGPTNLNIYVNGIKTAYYNYPTANINTSTGTLQIGGYNASFDNAGEYFNGYISEFIIFNRVLTDDENLSVTNYLNSKYAIYSSPYLQNGKLKIKALERFPIANLFAFWKLNESSGTRYDSSGNGRNLTEPDGAVPSTTGKIANCAYFSGTRLGSTSFGVNPNSNFSMSVWMKPRSFSSYQHIIGAPFQNGFYIGGNGPQFGSTVGYNLTFNLYNGTVFGISAPTTAFDTWHHYVFIREGDTLKLYADNVYIGSASVSGQSFVGDPVFSVGGGEFDEYYFNGDIDALGLWTRALTESEITYLYNGGNGIES